MKLYHSSSNREFNETTFVHFGSITAAARRIESKFTAAPRREYDGFDRFYWLDGSQTLNEALDTFVDYAFDHRLSLFEVEISNALSLNDKWGDDPIASGGIGIVNRDFLTRSQWEELKRLFDPFDGVLDVWEVTQKISNNKLKLAKQFCENNALAKRQYSARKRRARLLGEDWRRVSGYEALWVQRTIEFRLWAVNHGFDGFVYSNFTEDEGAESFVCLHDNQARHIRDFVFNKVLYLETIKPIFKSFLQMAAKPGSNVRRNDHGLLCDLMWAGKDPELFWK